jgi:hypothetical protein
LFRAFRILRNGVLEQHLDTRRAKGDGYFVQATVVFDLLDE